MRGGAGYALRWARHNERIQGFLADPLTAMTLVQAQIHRSSALALFLEYNHPEGETQQYLCRVRGENHFETGKRNLSVLIRIGYEIVLRLFNPSPVIFLLRVHPSRRSLLMGPEDFHVEPDLPVQYYRDSFGNHCGRLSAPAARIRFRNHAVLRDSGETDVFAPEAAEEIICQMPSAALAFLLPSRYCEVDSDLMSFAWEKFGRVAPGWSRVQAICDFVHEHIRFDYQRARPNRTALEALREGVGVCRDFTHLAITLCRCLNIPARYVTGYLGDIGVPPMDAPMDFSAWMEVYLSGRWFSFDARHNQPRIGRIVIARGRDAADVPITMAFANHQLERFTVVTEETNVNGKNNVQVQRTAHPRPPQRPELPSVEVRSLASRSCL